MLKTRVSCPLALMLVVLPLLACGSRPADKAAKPAPPGQQEPLRRERVSALENDLTRLEQLVEQTRQQQQNQFNQIQDLSQQLAAELAGLKAAMGMKPTSVGLKLPEVPDEAASGAKKAAAKGGGVGGILTRLFYVAVLLAVAFLFFKYVSRWQEPELEEEEQLHTDEGTITLSPEARRKGGELHPDDDQ